MVVNKKQNIQNERKSNNYGRANPLSRLCFCWMMPTFFRGFQRELDLEDLSLPSKKQLSQQLGDHLERYWFKEEKLAIKQNRQPSLRRALIKAFIWDYIPDNICLLICLICFKSLQPTVLAKLLKYFDKDQGVSKDYAFIYGGLLIGMTLMTAVISRHLFRRSLLLGLRLKVACSSLVYRKIMRMDARTLHQTAAGKLVNLLSNDISRFDMFLSYIPFIWLSPIQIVFVGYLMYNTIGWLAAIGIAAITLQTVPVQVYLSRISAKLRLAIAHRTDDRVKIMNEIINGIKVIKMYAWEKPFEEVVSKSRGREIALVTKASYVRAISCSFMVFTERTSLYVTILAYTLMGNQITSSVVFPLAQFFGIMKMSLALWLPNGIMMLSEAQVGVDRLRDLLISSERDDLSAEARPEENMPLFKKLEDIDRILPNIKEVTGFVNVGFENDETRRVSESSDFLKDDTIVELENVTAQWDAHRPVKTLNDITMRVKHGQLCVVIGSVGAGKSSLLQLLLGELTATQGHVSTQGEISYASQEPWLFVGTVRKNIIFGQPYDETLYKEVIRACAMEKDLKHFPNGDQTLVGERGVSLSGGQRARINLARAVYRKANIYLLDDPLSAVDAAVGRQLYENCINGYLKGHTRILVTHQLQYLKQSDLIVILNNGSIESIGTFDELLTSNENFAKHFIVTPGDTIESYGEMDSLIAHKVQEKQENQKNEVCKRKLSSEEQCETLEEEERESGSMNNSLYTSFWKNGNSTLKISFVCFVLIIGQVAATACDYWVTYWTNQQNSYNWKVRHMHIHSRNMSNNRYSKHFDLHEKLGSFSHLEYLYIYSAIVAMCIILTISRASLFFKLCMNSSKKLHDVMFHCLLRGVMRFFETNPSGRILNRFSKDIGTIDEVLPRMMMESLQTYLVMSSTIILVTVSLPWTLLMATIVVIVFLIMLKIYLKSAQAIKRIEGVSKSPVFSHVTSTLNGMLTIRCTNEQENFIKEFDRIQDVHTSTWNQIVGGSTTFGWWLDFVSIVFITIVIYAFLLIDDSDAKSGNIGLAISQALTLAGMLQATINQTTEAISQMTSVERIRQYTKIEMEEDNIENNDKSNRLGWPCRGNIQLKDLSLRYAEGKPTILKNLNIVIEHGWKVGIVGRTGAGKSSLITALFRLARVEGAIEIDGVETGSVTLQELRSNISIIPQEPVLFSSSVRYNLDPFDAYDDCRLWEALEAVDMKDAVPSLDHVLTQGGSNLSVGQRQLLCLARAILKNNKILVIDEATANVDPQTDAFIQNTIRRKFSKCTVLTIAHRLNTIMDSDRIIVMNFGEIVEFDHPYTLMTNDDSFLTNMAKEMGSTVYNQLLKITEECYVKTSSID